MPKNSVEFGWGAAPMIVQHPVLGKDDAYHFDEDNKAIVRLSVRGVITHSEKHAAYKRLTKQIEAAIKDRLANGGSNGE